MKTPNNHVKRNYCQPGSLLIGGWRWISLKIATEPGAGCAHFGRRGKGRAAAHCSLVAWSLYGSKDHVRIKTTNVFFCLIKASALAAKRWAEYLPRASQATESWSSRREGWDWTTFLTDCQPGPAGHSPAWQVMSMASWWQWTHVPVEEECILIGLHCHLVWLK